ncbi:MAG: MarR family transcriptional regulator [Lachnospiraceae bacterium]|nr:MarR family transcriptional regulator [Lachnospiraceae bacterium]
MDETKGGFLISQIKQIQGRIFSRLLTDAGIEEFNGAQGRILYVLWQEDNLPIVELSRRTGLAKTTLTSMLDRMENKGHVVRCYDLNDRRQIRIRLTDHARGLERKYQEVSEDMSRIFYKGFTEEEIKEFDAGLERVLRNLEEEGVSNAKTTNDHF